LQVNSNDRSYGVTIYAATSVAVSVSFVVNLMHD